MSQSQSPITFAPAIDWLTLATYQFTAYTDMAAFLRRFEPSGWRPGRWLQYDGHKHKDGMFYGKALQSNDREHYVVKISGSQGEIIFDALRDNPLTQSWYCTRLDLQRTRSLPEWWNVRELHDRMVKLGKKTSMIQSDTGNTLYLGARQSDRFTRFYEKDLGETYLRLEIELKGRYARLSWEMLRDGETVENLYAHHLRALGLPSNIMHDYYPDAANDIDWLAASHVTDVLKQLKWLESLVPTFGKMANDHDIGHQVRSIFYALSAEPIDTGNDDMLD